MATDLGSQLESLLSQMVERNVRRRGKPKEYSVGIIGVGTVGFWAADGILNELPEVTKLLLANRNIERCEGAREELKAKNYAKHRKLDVSICGYDNLEEMLQADIVVITAGANVTPGEPRQSVFGKNIRAIQEIARQFNGYKGAVIMVTNPIEPLTYAFAGYSEMDPAKVVGLTHVDTLRLQYIVAGILQEEYGSALPNLDAVVIGAHQAEYMIPVYSQARAEDKIPLDALRLVTEEFKKHGRDETVKYAPRVATSLKGIGGTTLLTTQAIVQVINAIIEEDQTVSAAVFLPQPEIYAAWPVTFSGFEAVPLKPEVFELNDEEQAEFGRACDGLSAFLSEAREAGLIGCYVRPIEKPPTETGQEVADIRRMVEEAIASRFGGMERRFRQHLDGMFAEMERKGGVSEGDAVNLAQRIGALEQELKGRQRGEAERYMLKGTKILAAAQRDGQAHRAEQTGVSIIDLDTRNIERHLGTINTVVGLTVAEVNGHKAILAGTRIGVQQWSPERMEVEKAYRAANTQHRINSIGVMAKDGEQYVVGASRGGDLYIWKAMHSTPIMHIELPSVISCSYLIDGRIIAGSGKGVYVLDLEGKEIGALDAGEVTCLTAVKTAKADYLFAGERNGTVRQWVYDNGKFVPGQSLDVGYYVNCIDGAEVGGKPAFVAGTFGGGLRIWSANGESIVFQGHNEEILAATLATAGRTNYLVAGGKNGSLYVWKTELPASPAATMQLGRSIEGIRIGGF